jgi:hypothetical protein
LKLASEMTHTTPCSSIAIPHASALGLNGQSMAPMVLKVSVVGSNVWSVLVASMA